jgi:5'-3' exonuclease
MIFAATFKKLRKPKKVVEVTKIVEIIKEVPVDKVVFQEVPVEVVRKEVIHTPIYTNDPDLLKFGTTKIKDVLKNEDDKEDEK